MTSQQHTIFPIKFNYNGVGFETKVIKYTYRQQVLYKAAMPSAVSDVQQCWLALNKAQQWSLIMGNIDQALTQQIINAIKSQEQIQAIYTDAQPKQELKSA